MCELSCSRLEWDREEYGIVRARLDSRVKHAISKARARVLLVTQK